MAIAGRVAIVPKGDWSADATYKRLDAVTNNNTLYFAKKDVPAGTATSNTEYWSKSIVGSVVTVDDTLSSTSTNPVQNKVVKAYVDKKVSENVDFSTSTSKTLNDTVEAPLMIGKATRNFLHNTIKTQTQNGLTCTNNGDGTYTLNGTANRQTTFIFADADDTVATFKGHSSLKLVGFPKKYASAGALQVWRQSDDLIMKDIGDGVIITGSNMPYGKCNMAFVIYNGAVTDGMIIKPMLTTDLEATYDDFVPYSGYNIKTIGKNLLNPTLQTTKKKGVTCTNNGDGTYTFNGTATEAATFIVQNTVDFVKKHINKDIRLVGCPKNGGVGNKYRLQFWGDSNGSVYDVGNGGNIHFKSIDKDGNIAIIIDTGVTVNNLVFKPMLTTDLNATYDDFVPYQDGGTVHIDSSTEFPLLGLKSFDGETNIISPGNVEVTYAKSDSGKAILDMSENKLDKDNVANNQTTTEAGYALDARQANPNIDGTLAKQVADLNGSLKGETVSSIDLEDLNTGWKGVLNFTVRNGICYVSAWGVSHPDGTGTNIMVYDKMPKAAMSSGVFAELVEYSGSADAFFFIDYGTNLLSVHLNTTHAVYASFSYPILI